MSYVYQEFCDQVLGAVPRATAREREAIRQELLDHLEDHALAMQERDWPTAEAEQRSVDCMGDPAEIGRDWNRQLSPFWLWVGRLARLATVLLVILILLPAVARVRGVLLNLEARWGSLDGYRYGTEDAVKSWELDERVEIGAYRLRFFQAALEPQENGGYELRVRVAIYAADPLRDTSFIVMDGVSDPMGDGWCTGGGTGLGDAVWYYSYYYPLGDTRPDSVTMSAANDHGSFSVDFAIDWRDVP